jgi:PncC family amidohydrolase
MNNNPLKAQVGAALLRRGWTICAAESCTGGLLLSSLTDVAGSSAYVLGGVVAYANEAKQGLLGVRAETLDEHGAVSAETAAEMLAGVLKQFAADVAISITGIAGPGGGTPTKPVGLVYIGISVPGIDLLRVDRHEFAGERAAIKAASAAAAMHKILAAAGE